MTTYQLIETCSGNWAIERFVDGASQGYTFGRYEDEAAASYIASVYARMDTIPRQSPVLFAGPASIH
jgi:hypothetical protein